MLKDLAEMQSIWFAIASAEAHQRKKNDLQALKFCLQIQSVKNAKEE